jgi:hypothetical protein
LTVCKLNKLVLCSVGTGAQCRSATPGCGNERRSRTGYCTNSTRNKGVLPAKALEVATVRDQLANKAAAKSGRSTNSRGN